MSYKQMLAAAAEHILPGSMIKYYLYTRSHHYEPELWLVPQFVDRSSVAIDVGGNAGVWSLQMARYAGRVHVFEPNPVCVRDLEKVIPRRVTLHRVALSDKTTTGNLRFDPQNTGIGTIEERNNLSDNPGIKTLRAVEVPTRPLDSFGIRNVSLIKIDVEGHEEHVLDGARGLIEGEWPTIICEIEERHNPGGFARVRMRLEGQGYSTFVVAPHLRLLSELPGEVPVASHVGVNNFVFIPNVRRRPV